MRSKTKKLIWAAPLLAVFAVAAALAIFAAQMPNPAEAHGLPGEVTNLMGEVDGNKAVDLSWTAPSDGGTATGYRIDVSGDGQTWSSLKADTGSTATTYRDDMVSGDLGSDRFYRVFALNSAGTSPASQTAGPYFVPSAGAPGNVTGITATAMGRKAITLTWTEPASTGGAKSITKYLVAGATGETATAAQTALDGLTVTSLPTYNDTDPSDSTTPSGNSADAVLFATQDATTSYTLKGLSHSETWFFRVYAYNGEKVSAGHGETRSATTDGLGGIGPATNVTAVEDPESGIVRLYWYWPADDGGRTISHWKVERKQTALSPLDQDSVNAGVQPQQNNESGVQLHRWQAITLPTASAATSTTNAYDYQIAVDAVMTVGDDSNISVLVAGASYQYRVTARTGVGADNADSDPPVLGGAASAASNTLKIDGPLDFTNLNGSSCTDLALHDSPTSTQRAAYNKAKAICDTSQARIIDGELSAKRDGKGNVEVTVVRGSPRKATSFRIDVAPVENDANKWKEVSSYVGNLGGEAEFVFEYEDPTTGGNLEYRVFAYVGSNQLLPSNGTPRVAGLKEVGKPGKAQNLQATAVSQTQIDVTWAAPKTDGDATVDMYCLQIRTDATGDVFDTLVTDGDHPADGTAEVLCAPAAADTSNDTFILTDKLSYSHTKLKASQTRHYRVYAINNPVFGGDERSTSSDEVSAKTMKQDAPTAPNGLTAETAKDANYGGRVNQGVYLLWNKPPNPTGGSVDTYVVQRKVDSGNWANLHPGSDTMNNRTIYHDDSEPKEGEMRSYRVAAKNSTGTSGWSNVSYYPVMHTADTAHVMATGSIGDVTVTEDMSETMDVSSYFTVTDGITYTAAGKTADDEMYATASVADGTSMVTITGVKAGMATITVTATEDATGLSAMQDVKVTVKSKELGAPTNVMACVGIGGDPPVTDPTDPGYDPDADPCAGVPIDSIKVTWTDGENADVHDVFLVDINNFPSAITIRIAEDPSAMKHTFSNVPSGTYVVAVQSTLGEDYKYDVYKQENGKAKPLVIP